MNVSRRAVLALSFALVVPLAHGAMLYKWVDKNGNVSYQDQPPPPDAGRVEEERALSTGDTGGQAQHPPVVLYSVPKCGSCDLARVYLQKRQIPFTEKNVGADVKLQAELKQKAGGLSVPTILIGDKVMRGYMESLLDDELTQAGYPKPHEAKPAATPAEDPPASDTP